MKSWQFNKRNAHILGVNKRDVPKILEECRQWLSEHPRVVLPDAARDLMFNVVAAERALMAEQRQEAEDDHVAAG